MIRVATFNVENLFCRPLAMDLDDWSEGQPAIDAAAQLNSLFNQPIYSDADKKTMLATLEQWGLLSSRPNNRFLEFRKIRGDLFRLPSDEPPEIVANGRASWVGWVELKEAPVNDEAIKNTARVISEVDADIICLVEVDSRIALQRFYDAFIVPLQTKSGQKPYPYNMAIDGNDQRGIDVAILSRYPITSMRSHIDAEIDGKKVFSRDCPEYYVQLPSGEELVLLPNHFASKGSDVYGERRRVQSKAVAEIYEAVRKTHEQVIIAGDLNDHPAGESLDDLLKHPELVDVMAMPQYKQTDLPGTYKTGTAAQKLDYLLLSPHLQKRVKAVEVFRKGSYAPQKWASFENINKDTRYRYQASDHQCVWADLDI